MPTSKEELLRRGLKPHEIQHNQHRRAEWKDYGNTGLYMVTLCVEGRQGLFGHLEGDIRAKHGSASFPHIVLSPIGHAILEEELPKIPSFLTTISSIFMMWMSGIFLHICAYIAYVFHFLGIFLWISCSFLAFFCNI